jgi:hypothetical protein
MSESPPTDEDKDPFLGAEMADRAERKRAKLKEKKDRKKDQDELDAVLGTSKLGEAQKARRKKQIKYALIGAGVLLLVWAGNYLFAPYQAGPTYGICRVYLENTLRFPGDMRLSTIEDLRPKQAKDSLGGVRIWYTQVDAFGKYRMENIECFYKQDPERGAMVDTITINRRPVDPEQVAKFNTVLPVVMANMPDLTYPDPLPDSLSDLQINTDSLRLQLNINKR